MAHFRGVIVNTPPVAAVFPLEFGRVVASLFRDPQTWSLLEMRASRACLPLSACLSISLLAVGCGRTSAAVNSRGGRGAGGGAQPVVMAKATQQDVPVDLAAVGNVEASASIAVRSQVTGQLEEVHFREGDFVKKGDPLFSIDRRPLEAAVEQAKANLMRDQALFAQAEAQLARDAANAEY